MFNRDRWKEILEVLTSNWFRTTLTAFGVFWGILILIVLLSAGKGLENGIRSNFGDIATNTMFMWTQGTSMAYKGLPKSRKFNFKLDDVAAIKQNVPELRYVSPRNQLGGFNGANNVVRGIKTGAFNVYGDYPDIINQDPMGITSGRFINQLDIEEKRKVAIIGEGVRASLYDQGETVIGTYIKIQGVNFMVIGTYKKKSNNGNMEEVQKEIFIPFTTFSQALIRVIMLGGWPLLPMIILPSPNLRTKFSLWSGKIKKFIPMMQGQLDILICMKSSIKCWVFSRQCVG